MTLRRTWDERDNIQTAAHITSATPCPIVKGQVGIFSREIENLHLRALDNRAFSPSKLRAANGKLMKMQSFRCQPTYYMAKNGFATW